MADTERSRAYLETALADNTTGAITAQVMRDLLKSTFVTLRGNGAPTINPERAGDHYVDETTGEEYIATTANGSPTDEAWRLISRPVITGLAIAYRTSNYTLTSSNTYYSIPWNTTRVDIGGWWDSGQASRLTVPAGVTRVIVIMSAQISATQEAKLRLRLNGGAPTPEPHISAETALNSEWMTIQSPIIEVSQGDYLEMQALSGWSGNDLIAGASSFEVRAI